VALTLLEMGMERAGAEEVNAHDVVGPGEGRGVVGSGSKGNKTGCSLQLLGLGGGSGRVLGICKVDKTLRAAAGIVAEATPCRERGAEYAG
jgi:hypothetical protein